MKTTVAACAAAILTTASLIACIGWSSTSAFASQAGMGGGSHPTGTTPSHPSAFGRSFAGTLVTAGIGVSGPGELTSGDRWGPNNTVAFGNPTRGWGPSAKNKRPGYVSQDAYNVTFRCPCVVAYDPFKPSVFGGVPLKAFFLNGQSFSLPKIIAAGVVDQAYVDKTGHVDVGATETLNLEIQDMGNVWGSHFDPAAPVGEGFIKGPDHGTDPFNNVGTNPNTFGSVR